jgi:hypothetical protein
MPMLTNGETRRRRKVVYPKGLEWINRIICFGITALRKALTRTKGGVGGPSPPRLHLPFTLAGHSGPMSGGDKEAHKMLDTLDRRLILAWKSEESGGRKTCNFEETEPSQRTPGIGGCIPYSVNCEGSISGTT